jgi:signal peptide peptidase SppA
MKKFVAKLPFVRKRGPLVAVVKLNGVITAEGRFGQGLCLNTMAGALKHAFDLPRLKAVALVVNSPGGSPVQSSLIFKRIRALADENGVPVFAFMEDVAASGGYYISVAADEIFADESSIVGSIGVVSAGFGFDKAIEKFGVERRIYTAGERKATLDPFQPENEEDIKRLLALQKEVHSTFKTVVKERRGERLTGSDEKLFSGEFWSGTQAVKLGLIDGIGDLRSVMRRRFGKKVRLVVVTQDRSWLKRRLSGLGLKHSGTGASTHEATARSLGSALAGEMIGALEERSLWSRFGL